MDIQVTTHIDVKGNVNKVRDKSFWLFAANEWWKLITPYVPMETGALSESVHVNADEGSAELEYFMPYASNMYEHNYNFRKDKHPLASSQWDKTAEPTQKPKLIGAMQDYVDSGRLDLQ